MCLAGEFWSCECEVVDGGFCQLCLTKQLQHHNDLFCGDCIPIGMDGVTSSRVPIRGRVPEFDSVFIVITIIL